MDGAVAPEHRVGVRVCVMYLCKRQSENENARLCARVHEIFHSPVHSPNARCGQEPRTLSLMWMQEPKALDQQGCQQGAASEVEQRGPQLGADVGCGHRRWQLSPLCRSTGP